MKIDSQQSLGDMHDPSDPDALITLQLLARGIIQLYRYVGRGGIVGHSDRHQTGSENTPVSLHQAMAQLGRQYFSEGHQDRAASVHQLLVDCTTPLTDWAPRVVASLEPHQQAVLIDPAYLVPSEDCEAIAEAADGTSLSDLIEHHLHARLCTILDSLGSDADRAYTRIREFVGRHGLASRADMAEIANDPELTDDAVSFVKSLYYPVHASHAQNNAVGRCAFCHGLITAEGRCQLDGCCADHPTTQIAEWVPSASAFSARPEVLKYWVDPAREELRIYDALRGVRGLREHVLLYPHSDWCDISIDEEIGVDVKDYRDPVRLAHRLSRSIGHLDHYPTRILAVAKRRWTPLYRDQLQEHLSPSAGLSLQVMSVDETIRTLTRRGKPGAQTPRRSAPSG